MRKLITVCSIALLAGTALWLSACMPSPPERQLFINANVLTMDGQNARAQAVAVERDRIMAVGTTEEILKWRDAKTTVHDLAGKTLLPGFIDAHSHFPGLNSAELVADLSSPPVGKITTIQALLQALKHQAAKRPAGQWVVGVGYDDSMLSDNRPISRWDLDRVSPQHPIFVMHVSGHIAVVNSAALALLGLDADSAPPAGGVYGRDPDGQLNGVLEETARLDAAARAMDFSLFQFLRLVRDGATQYAKAGVTTAQSGLTSDLFLKGLKLAATLGAVPQRLVIWPDEALGTAWAKGETELASGNSEQFKVGAVKLVADGSIQGFTAYLSSPYFSVHNHTPDYRGYPSIDQAALEARVEQLHVAGLQIAVHANGDAAVENVLQAFEKAQKDYPRPDARHIIVHSQMATEAQLKRMVAAGVTPSFFSAHVYYWGDRHRDLFIGPERAANISPAHSAQQLGLRFSVHLDTPVVPMQPLLAAWSSTTRLTSSGQALGPEQRIDPMLALRAITIDAAWQVFEENSRGSIEPGKLADLVVLAADPIQEAQHMRDIQVLRTIVGGTTIFSADQPEQSSSAALWQWLK